MPYVDRLRAAAATRLIQQPKIPQTDEGQVVAEGALLQVHEQFVRNGFLGQNLTWNGASFGEVEHWRHYAARLLYVFGFLCFTITV